MAEIGRIAIDSRRNDSLYELVAHVGVARVKELLDEVDALDRAPHRPDLARIIYIRFAAVDPEAAVDDVIARAYRTSWLTAVFRAWAHADLDAAVARAQTLDGQAKLLATRAILELELPAWQREKIADRLGGVAILASMRADEDLRGETDFSVAWGKAVLIADDTVRRQRLEEIVAAWAEQDPIAAMAAATELAAQPPSGDPLSPSLGLLLQNRVMEIWATADTEGAVAWISEQESTRTVQSTTNTLIIAVAQGSLADAISTLDVLPEDLVAIAQRGFVASMSQRDVNDADFDHLMDWYTSLEPANKTFLAPFLSQAVVARDAERAFDWAVSLEGGAQRNAVLNVTWRISLNEPEMAKRLVKTIDDEALQQIAAENLVNTEAAEDPRGALDWASSFTSKTVRRELVNAVFRRWSSVDPDEAVREVLRMRDADIRDDVASRIASSLMSGERAQAFGESRVDLAEQLFEAIRSPDVRRDLAKALQRYYVATEPDPAKARRYAARIGKRD
ncbi:MAG: hypothetical protein F4Z28_03070 [Gammaproteobacteria bacterium]|nr:hypothetical protein [Gammaproteobacteria bacterium]